MELQEAMNSNGQEDGGKQRETGDLAEKRRDLDKSEWGVEISLRGWEQHLSRRAPRPTSGTLEAEMTWKLVFHCWASLCLPPVFQASYSKRIERAAKEHMFAPETNFYRNTAAGQAGHAGPDVAGGALTENKRTPLRTHSQMHTWSHGVSDTGCSAYLMWKIISHHRTKLPEGHGTDKLQDS